MSSSPPADPPAAASGHGSDDTDAAAAAFEHLALRLVRGACEVVRTGRQRALVVDAKSTATDLVTEVDRETERWLVAEIARVRPDDAVLGEEGGGHDTDAGARVRWVIDPIDGTVNFVLGIPYYAVSVAVEVEGRVVAGAVGNPVSGELFHARLGGGAYLLRNGAGDGPPAASAPEALHGPRRVPLDRAVVATGFAYDVAVRSRQIAVVAALMPRIADVRRLGAAALDLCSLAAGRVDAHFEAGLNLWDHAAGGLVAAEAGCIVSGLRGEPASGRMLAAAGPDLAGDLRAALEDLDADTVQDDPVQDDTVQDDPVQDDPVQDDQRGR